MCFSVKRGFDQQLNITHEEMINVFQSNIHCSEGEKQLKLARQWNVFSTLRDK